MTKELFPEIEIQSGETIRDRDGLALSSRNNYLTKAQRKKALHLYETLKNINQISQNKNLLHCHQFILQEIKDNSSWDYLELF